MSTFNSRDENVEDMGYDRGKIDKRFSSSPLEVAQRMGQVLAAVARVKLAGDEDGGQTLRQELANLGPVFCKVGQTLATRPDIIGAETSRKLGQLQDAMAPEPDSATAFATLRAFLRQQGLGGEQGAGDEIERVFSKISRQPVAAASLAEVYRATTREGVEVAVKIQRPGLEKKIALDFYVLLKLLGLAQQQFQISESLEIVEAVLDEVGAGIFKELDFRQEARHILAFEEMYAADLDSLGVVVPRVVSNLTGRQVLVTEWINGRPPRDLPPRERSQLAKTAVKCLAMQLMSKGFIHCDPHEGNLLALPDGRVALIDFGLMAQMDRGHQEAMASGVLNIMAENYEALVDIFKEMGVLDSSRADLRRPGTTEDFSVALRRCMSGDSVPSDERQQATTTRRKFIQGSEVGDRRKAFGQLYEELGELAFNYYFVIPSYYILVMRAFVTLEGIALSASDYSDFNMYSETAVYARKLILTPKTAGGRMLLKKALFTKEGRRALFVGFKGALPASRRRLLLALLLLPARILGAVAAALKALIAPGPRQAQP